METNSYVNTHPKIQPGSTYLDLEPPVEEKPEKEERNITSSVITQLIKIKLYSPEGWTARGARSSHGVASVHCLPSLQRGQAKTFP